MQTLKNNIIHSLESNDLSKIASLAKENRKVLSQLIRMAYDKETLVGRRAIMAIGFAAKEMLAGDYPFLRETVRKLLWTLSDESGGIGWSAPEMLGEIVSADPEKFRDIVPLIAEVYSVEETVFRTGVLYALARVAEAAPHLVLRHADLLLKGLEDNDPTVRVHALELAGILKDCISPEFRAALVPFVQELKSDNAEVWIYKSDTFVNIQVKESAVQIEDWWDK